MADEPLAGIDELKARLDWTLDADETRLGIAALEDLSHEARYFGSTTWSTQSVAPPFARTIILKAASRYMKNIEGYVKSRAADEEVQWAEIPDIMGTASFTADEQQRLSLLARPSALLAASVYAYGSKNSLRGVDNTVPVFGGGRRFRFLTDEEARDRATARYDP